MNIFQHVRFSLKSFARVLKLLAAKTFLNFFVADVITCKIILRCCRRQALRKRFYRQAVDEGCKVSKLFVFYV